MFTRGRKKSLAFFAIIAVLFAALMPSVSSFARVLNHEDVVALGGVCFAEHAAGDRQLPASHTAKQGHCAFCTLGAPLVSAPRVDLLLVTLDAPASVVRVHRNDVLPRDAVAIHPLSPRAPPRAI